MKKFGKPFGQMNATELATATQKYDKPFGGWDEFKPLTARDRAIHRAARKRGRPKVGRGAKRVMITMEMNLLKEADARAKRLGISRSELIANSIRSTLKAG